MEIKKLSWLTFGSIITLSLLMTSCGNAPQQEQTQTQTTTTAAQPTYGGELRVVLDSEIIAFDLCTQRGNGQTVALTNEMTAGGDWAQGPAGTNQVDFLASGYSGISSLRGLLAETWEFPEIGTVVFHIRKGVYWQDIPNSDASALMGGRQFTADDLIFNLTRYRDDPKSTKPASQPGVYKEMTVEKLDEWMVKVRSPIDPWTGFVFHCLGYAPHYAPEVIQKYGDASDWRNAVGTGPFMLTDYVKSASATLLKNPKYWDTDPVGPGKGNQLPYVDSVKLLIITDASTRMAAIRTAKADWVTNVLLEDAKSLQGTTPELKYLRRLTDRPWLICMQTAKTDLPFSNVKVRQALTMAIDFNAIKDDYFLGEAQILNFPQGPHKGLEQTFIPLDQLPASARALYEYTVDRAKQLLSEAGYAQGFTAKITTRSVPGQIDYLSLIKDMWAKIGVTLEIDPRDSGAFTGLVKTYDQMLFDQTFPTTNTYADLTCFRGETYPSRSNVEDAHVREVYAEMKKNYLVNQPKVDELFKGLFPYLVEQAYYIEQPTPYVYSFWWPWIKNYHGEVNINYTGWDPGGISWTTFVWLDQDARKLKTGE